MGRNVNHDSRSKAYRLPRATPGDVRPVRHESHIGILDQLSTGACTGMSGLAAIYRTPFVSGVVKPWKYRPTVEGAYGLYSAATVADKYQGSWIYPPPPGTGEDTGSDGLSIAKVLKADGIISGYLWAFTLMEAVAALAKAPVITGVPWYRSMFDTTSDGHAGHVQIRQDSGMSGGHELCVDELVDTGGDVLDWYVGGPNSWGTSWGDGGRWYWTVREWGWLLDQQGDVVQFVPGAAPAPVPDVPEGDEGTAGDVLWASVGEWAGEKHTGGNNRAARAVREWAKVTGRS